MPAQTTKNSELSGMGEGKRFPFTKMKSPPPPPQGKVATGSSRKVWNRGLAILFVECEDEEQTEGFGDKMNFKRSLPVKILFCESNLL